MVTQGFTGNGIKTTPSPTTVSTLSPGVLQISKDASGPSSADIQSGVSPHERISGSDSAAMNVDSPSHGDASSANVDQSRTQPTQAATPRSAVPLAMAYLWSAIRLHAHLVQSFRLALIHPPPLRPQAAGLLLARMTINKRHTLRQENGSRTITNAALSTNVLLEIRDLLNHSGLLPILNRTLKRQILLVHLLFPKLRAKRLTR